MERFLCFWFFFFVFERAALAKEMGKHAEGNNNEKSNRKHLEFESEV